MIQVVAEARNKQYETFNVPEKGRCIDEICLGLVEVYHNTLGFWKTIKYDKFLTSNFVLINDYAVKYQINIELFTSLLSTYKNCNG